MNDKDLIILSTKILEYCNKFDIPLEYLFEILEDQKVTPMIRGKAMEYNAFLLLDNQLAKNIWSVQKLNLNAQTGTYDEDITITHRRTGIILKVESKSAVRGSISGGKRARLIKEPHFRVKCHRSRSNIKLAGSSNDRYSVDCFDLIITNPLNAIYQGNTIGEELEIIDNENIKELLVENYDVKNNTELIKACSTDWRFCIPKDIAKADFIPRTPSVKLYDDPNWRPIEELERKLSDVVKARKGSSSRRKR